ncbi:diaminopimelate epimerase [Haloparvum sp. PAK95]|uniref:diaminopimelate epimerase n=1 Tax=Haloparvum sp. PAK95 TaxID=3418962 RepID=UPI003D2EEDB2
MSQRSIVPFAKYHGTGNDFFIVDANAPLRNRRAFARRHCDRDTGTVVDGRRGADGVLFLDIESTGEPTRVNMTLVQPDGSTAAMCGNGARCVAAWAHERTGETEFMIDTQAGTRHATIEPVEGEDGDADATDAADADKDRYHVEIEMGEPAFDPARVPVESDEGFVERDLGGFTVTAVNTGVPHAVAFVDDVDAVDVDDAAEPIRHADVFPEGANVNFASRAETAGTTDVPTFDQRTYERGVEGETRSCGTGAVAVAAVASHLGLVDDETVRTRPPGGELETTVPETGPATLAGPVVRDGAGEFDAGNR